MNLIQERNWRKEYEQIKKRRGNPRPSDSGTA